MKLKPDLSIASPKKKSAKTLSNMHNYNEIVEELCKERTSSTTVISKQ
jgi:hypothetical protein